jgi:chorismate mutase
MGDPIVDQLRAEISESDRAILAAMNRRIDLVVRLWRHKDEQGIPVVDADRERQIAEQLAAANGGPMSEEGVHDLVRAILDLTKTEVSRSGER